MPASSAPPPDEEIRLVLRAMAGDRQSFDALVARRQAWVRTFVRRGSAMDSRADDLAQEVFVKAWRNLDRLRDATAFAGWLRRIAVHTVIDAARASRAADDPLGDDVADLACGESDVIRRLDLQAALSRLSPGQRLCVLLVHGEGLTHAETAEETGMPVGTVKSHVARGGRLLRTWLAESGDLR